MKVIVAAGGTGGHIYPGVAIAKCILKNNPKSEIVFVGTNRGLEKDLVPKEGFHIELIRVKGFERKLSLDTLRSIREMFLGLLDARRILKRFKPDVVIGTGGYVCGPVLFAAWQLKIPTLIHEQNAFPGITNRILSKFVDKIAVSFEDAKKFFKYSNKVFVSGNPIRDEFKKSDRSKAREALKIPMDKTLIVATGGSQGALSINKSMIKVIKELKERSDVYVVHITGKRQYNTVIEMLQRENVIPKDHDNIDVLPYSYQMSDLIKACNLIISRAGAMTVSEICAVGRSSILIPYPYATGNHQEYNARVITDKDGGVLILDKDLNGDLLMSTIDSLISKPEKIRRMEYITAGLGITDGDEKIYNEVSRLIK